MHSIGCSIEKTKALVEGGADINYQTRNGKTAAIKALMYGGPTTLISGLEYAHFLITEKHADVTKPWVRRPFDGPPSEAFPVELLQDWIFDLDSDRHKLKMEIVKEFERQGINYREIEIPKYTLKEIQERYPDTWEEYIKNY